MKSLRRFLVGSAALGLSLVSVVSNADTSSTLSGRATVYQHLDAKSLEDVSTNEAILDVSLEAAAIEALTALYREAGRYPDLIALYERQLDGKVGLPASHRVEIAKIAREHTGDVQRAFDELGEAIASDPSHGRVGSVPATNASCCNRR